MATKRRQQTNPMQEAMEAQKAANEYARGVFSTVSFHLGSLSDDEMRATSDVIVEQLVRAWGAGWQHGRR